MRPVNIHEAKTHLSRLLARVVRGAEIILARAGRPVAKIAPITPHVVRRKPGTARGKISITPDFDTRLPNELQKHFE